MEQSQDTNIKLEFIEMINNIICGKYIRDLEIEYDEDLGFWTLFLFLNRNKTPIILSYQGSFEEFKNFVYKEIKTRKLQRVSFWNLERTYDIDIKKCNE